jgi:hypothetical protein
VFVRRGCFHASPTAAGRHSTRRSPTA